MSSRAKNRPLFHLKARPCGEKAAARHSSSKQAGCSLLAARAAAMSDEGRFTARERWLFDLNGFVVVDDALAPSKCDDLNALLDTEIEGVPASLCCHCPVDVSVPVEVLGGEEGFSGGQAGEKGHTHRFGDFLDPGRPLHSLFLLLAV